MNIPILMYHHLQAEGSVHSDLVVSIKAFERQMAWLKRKGYNTVSMERLAAFLQEKDELPSRPVVITFDDGYQSVADLAKPVLDQHGFTATVFLVPHALGKHNLWDQHQSVPILPCMDRRSCQHLVDDGWELGSHGLTHQSLPEMEPIALKDEVKGSKITLEQLFDCAIKSFCYPYGAWDKNARAEVKKAGYETACAISPGTASVTEDPWALRRIYVKGSDQLMDFKRKVSPWYLKYRAWRKR